MIRAAFLVFHVLIGFVIIFMGDGGLMWIADSILMTFPLYYILVTFILGSLVTLI